MSAYGQSTPTSAEQADVKNVAEGRETSAESIAASANSANASLTFSVGAKKCTERKPAHISFEQTGENRLEVHIETDRLHLQSITEKDVDNCCTTFGSSIVMEKYAYGKPYTKARVAGYVYNWAEHWKNNYPFSGLAVFNRENDDFVGHVDLGFGSARGTTVLAYLFRPEYWNTKHKKEQAESFVNGATAAPKKEYAGIGTEAVSAVVLDYAPQLKVKGYRVMNSNENGTALEQNIFTSIVTTVHTGNLGSQRVLKNVGMERVDEKPVTLFNGPRYRYSKQM